MIGFLVVINKNGQDGSSYQIHDNNIYKFGSGFDCQVRFSTKKRTNQNYCTMSIKNRMVKLQKLSSFPVLVNNKELGSSKILKSGDIIKIGPKTFKWTTNPESSLQNKSLPINTKICTSSLIGKRRSTEFVNKINRRSMRNSTSSCLSAWEETNESLQPSSKEAAMSRRSLRNSTSGRFSTWKETNEILAPSSKDIKMEQYTISESPLKTSSSVTNESPNTMLKKKTPRRKSNASNFRSKSVATKSSLKKASKIPRITGLQTKIKLEENESPRSARKARDIIDSPRKFSTTTFAVKINASSAATTEFKEILSDLEKENTEMLPDTLKVDNSLTELKENVSLVESEPKTFNRKTRKSITEPTTPKLHISAVDFDLKENNTKPLRTSPRKTPTKLASALSPKKSVKESTLTLHVLDSVPVRTNVKTPDTSMHKPLVISSIKAIKSANKRTASLEKSLDHMMIAKKRNISNVMSFDLSNIELQEDTPQNVEDLIIFPSSESKPHSPSKSNKIAKSDTTYLVPLDTTQNIDSMNVSGIKKLVRTPKALRNSSKSPGSRKSLRNLSTSDEPQYVLDSPEKRIITKNISYSTPKTKFVADWDIVDLSTETPKNTSFVQDTSVSETTANKSTGRKSQTPKQNLSVSNSSVDSPKRNTSSVTRSLRAVTPKHVLTVGDIFDESSSVSEIFHDSPKHSTTTINRSLRSMHSTPDISIGDRSLRSILKTPKQNQTLPSNLIDSLDNNLSNIKNRSLRSATPVNITGNSSGRKSKSPKENLIISENNTPERSITTGKKSMHGTPDVSISNQTFNKSLGRRSQTPTQNQTLSSNLKDSEKNMSLSFRDRSLRSISGTPENVSSSSQTIDISEQNLIASSTFYDSSNINTSNIADISLRSILKTPKLISNLDQTLGRRTPKQNQTLPSNLNDTPDNNISNIKNRSLRSLPATPVNITGQTLGNSSGRGSKTPKENLIVSENNTPERNITTGKKSKTPKQNLIVSRIFDESPTNKIDTIRKSFRSIPGTPDHISLSDQSFDETGRKSKSPQKQIIVSLDSPIKEDLSITNNLTNRSSPLKTPKDLADIKNVVADKQLLRIPGNQQKEPKNDLSDLRGVKRLLEPLKTLKSPKNDLTNIAGIKALLKTPARKRKEIEPENDLSNVAGVKHLLKTPKRKQKEIEPNNDLRNVLGVKQLLRSPRRQQNDPENDLTNVAGVNHLFKTPLRKQKEIEPVNDLTNVAGVKNLLKTPERKQKETEPNNDLRNVFGVKQLMRSPRRKQNDPENDLTNVAGVKHLLKTPVRKPKEIEPVNDLTNVAGVKNLLKTPERKQKESEPENDLSDVLGVEQLMRSPQRKQQEPKNDTSLDDLFDKLTKNDESIIELENSPHRHVSKTYERKVKSLHENSNNIDNSLKTRNSLRFVEKDTKVVDKWLEDVKNYHDILAGCSVNIDSVSIEQEPVQDQLKTETRKRNLRSKKIEITENDPKEEIKPRTRGRRKIVDAVVDSPSTRTRRNNKKVAEEVTKETIESVQDENMVEEEPIQKIKRGRPRKVASKKTTQGNELIENEMTEESPELVQNIQIVEEAKQKTTRGRQRKAANKKTIQQNELIENEMTEDSPELVQNDQIVEEAKQKTTMGRQRKATSKETTQENKEEEETEEMLSDQIIETRKGRSKQGVSKKTNPVNKKIDDPKVQKRTRGNAKTTNTVEQDNENEPEEIIEAPKTRIMRAKRGQKVDNNEAEEIAIINSEPEKNTRSLRAKRQIATEETESPALKRTRKNNVKSDSPVVEEIVIVKKTTRTIRNIAKPVVFSETVEILEHTDLPQLDIESLGVKPKTGRKRNIKDDAVMKQKLVRFEESPVTVVKEPLSTEQAKNEPATTVRRSARTKK